MRCVTGRDGEKCLSPAQFNLPISKAASFWVEKGDGDTLICHQMCGAYGASCDKTLESDAALSCFKNISYHLNFWELMPHRWHCVCCYMKMVH